MHFIIKEYETLESTNDTCKQQSKIGAPEGTVILANEQTRGKGRQGRSFFSPADTGLYMSLLLKPSLASTEALFITTTAAVAVAEALREVAGVDAGIKWVNDIYVDGRKVCGILTEAMLSEENTVTSCVLGIGVNISTAVDDFPDELKSIAGSVCSFSGENTYASNKKSAPTKGSEALKTTSDSGKLRSILMYAILERFGEYYENFDKALISRKYKELSAVYHRDIWILDEAGRLPAYVEDIDEDCRLHVRLEDGSLRVLSSGEVSTRIMR